MTELTLEGKTTDSGSGVFGSDTPGICGSIRGIPPFKLDNNLAVFGGIDEGDDDDDSEEEDDDVVSDIEDTGDTGSLLFDWSLLECLSISLYTRLSRSK